MQLQPFSMQLTVTRPYVVQLIMHNHKQFCLLTLTTQSLPSLEAQPGRASLLEMTEPAW
jgi:hypothetical protein